MKQTSLATPLQVRLGIQAFLLTIANIFDPDGPADIQGWVAGPTTPAQYVGFIVEIDGAEALESLAAKVRLFAGDITIEVMFGKGNTCGPDATLRRWLGAPDVSATLPRRDGGDEPEDPAASFVPVTPSPSPAAPAANDRRCDACPLTATQAIHRNGRREAKLCDGCYQTRYIDTGLDSADDADYTVTPLNTHPRITPTGAVEASQRIALRHSSLSHAELRRAQEAQDIATRTQFADAAAKAGVERARALRAAYGTEKATEIINQQADELFAA